MIDEPLQEQAALYAAGALSVSGRAHFELILKFHTELRALVAELEEITAAAAMRPLPAGAPCPSPALRARLLGMLDDRMQVNLDESFVMTDAGGFVKWVNPAFTAMCGYDLSELTGKKLGPILQGPQTDRATAERMRRAIHEYRPCVETIINYDKSGRPYWVEIAITPIPDEIGAPRWLVACEREVTDRPLAAA